MSEDRIANSFDDECYDDSGPGTTNISSAWWNEVAVTRGYCFQCDKPVDIEYHQWWVGEAEPPKRCTECGSADVEFMNRVAERLWEKLQTLQDR
jgi:hypothetical protein